MTVNLVRDEVSLGVRGHHDHGHPEADGALPGSDPLWGEYFPWSFPNWGVKFFADSLLLSQGQGGADELRGVSAALRYQRVSA